MPTPATRTPVRIARGTYSNLNSSIADLQEGEICYATDENKCYVIEGGALTSLPAGDVTLTGTQTLTNKTLTDPAIIGTILEDVFTITDGAAFEIDPGNGSIQLITLGANRTPKATNFAAGESVTLMVDDGSAYTLTWSDSTFGGSGVVWKTGGGVYAVLREVAGFALRLYAARLRSDDDPKNDAVADIVDDAAKRIEERQ